MNLPPKFFKDAHHNSKNPGHTLRFIHYPALAEQPSPECVRQHPHTDWGSLTLLFAGSEGLEVKSPAGDWTKAPLIPDTVLVNVGDALQIWSANQLMSTVHRISWSNLPYNKERYSIAYFVNPNSGTNNDSSF